MNIFKALSQGNGKISETNITSFMSYLLDSSNELNNAFSILFLNQIINEIKSDELNKILEIEKHSIREQIITFSNKFNITSEPEYPLINNQGKKIIPDTLLRISSKNGDEDFAYFIIENKIKKKSLKIQQIENQYEIFKQSEDFDENTPTYSLLISPNESAFESLIEQAKRTNPNTIWLKWTDQHSEKNSILGILKQLIIFEQNAEIEPIDINTKFILKSFIDYLATEFPFKTNLIKNFNYNGFDEVENATVIIDNKTYIIKRFSNKMIRLFDKKNNLKNIEVKPVLRKTIQKYNLKIELTYSTGRKKNTQRLGREVIRDLNLLEK